MAGVEWARHLRVNETLTEIRGTELKPRLATEWSQVDDDTWRIKLRDGVTFHDGTTLDAADVAFTLDRIKVPEFGCEVGVKYFGDIEFATEAVDDLTVEITTTPGSPILPLLLSTVPIVPSETPADKFVDEPVGTGPYLFEVWNPGQDIVLKRNPDYWGEAPQVEEATYLFRSDPAVAAAMVEAGEADIVPNLSMDQATNPETDFSYPNSETTTLRIDTTMAPTDDRRIREAMNLAIDREAFRRHAASRPTSAGDADGRADDDRLQPRPQGLALRSRARQGADRGGPRRRRAGRHRDPDRRPHRHPPQRHRGDGGDDGDAAATSGSTSRCRCTRSAAGTSSS